nr:MAG TPA: hypothetical protein [Bacteriophage sp.]
MCSLICLIHIARQGKYPSAARFRMSMGKTGPMPFAWRRTAVCFFLMKRHR